MNHIAALQCPFCNSNRKVLYAYPSDTYWCAKCKKHGLISDLDPSLLSNITLNTPTKTQTTKYAYNNAGKRFSVCKDRYSDSSKDVFQIKLPNGTLLGHYSRMANKVSRIEGVKGFCYRESFLDLQSTYRLVEGTYDCIYPNDVAVLGYPTQFQANQLKWYKLILCPDGDIWLDTKKVYAWLKPFWHHKNIQLERIKGNLDPDEVRQEQRNQLDFETVKRYLKGLGY